MRFTFTVMTMLVPPMECSILPPKRKPTCTRRLMKRRKSFMRIRNMSNRPCCRVGINFALREALSNSLSSYPVIPLRVDCGPHVSSVLLFCVAFDLRFCAVCFDSCDYVSISLTLPICFIYNSFSYSLVIGKSSTSYLCWIFRFHVAIQLQ